jgi:hypothetical protein
VRPIIELLRLRVLTLAACGAAAALIAAAPAQAATSTTNGGATSVTATSATLNGSLQVTYPDSAWAFQYGTTTAYGKVTQAQIVQPGSSYAVSIKVSGLTPGTTYHFRLVVYQETTTTSDFSASQDRSFQTLTGGQQPVTTSPSTGTHPAYGTAALRSRSLAVRRGNLEVQLRCVGKKNSRCTGSLTVSAPGKHGRSVRCAATGFSLSAGSSRTLRPRASSGCTKLLAAARRHRIRATLRASFSTHQAPLRVPVTLHR